MSPTSYENSSFERSADNLRALVSGRLVGIRRITTDRYGRTVAELFIDDKNVGQQQVLNGYAVISREHAWQCAWSARSWSSCVSFNWCNWWLATLRSQFCDTWLSVDDHWHSASRKTEWFCEEGFYTEWKLGNTPFRSRETLPLAGFSFVQCLPWLPVWLASFARQMLEYLVCALWLGIDHWLFAWSNGWEWSYSKYPVVSQAREMINAHLFPILAVVATVSSVSVAISLRPIAQHSNRWNLCYADSIAWYLANKPDWTVQDKEVFASNFCNGGTPVMPGPGFKPATWFWSGSGFLHPYGISLWVSNQISTESVFRWPC